MNVLSLEEYARTKKSVIIINCEKENKRNLVDNVLLTKSDK